MIIGYLDPWGSGPAVRFGALIPRRALRNLPTPTKTFRETAPPKPKMLNSKPLIPWPKLQTPKAQNPETPKHEPQKHRPQAQTLCPKGTGTLVLRVSW